MRKWSYVLLVLQTLLCYPAIADIKMCSHRVVKVRMSNKSLGRISVKGQRIEHVFVHPASINRHLHLHDSGNLYISPQGLAGPVFLSIITEDGLTQDLAVHFVLRSAKPVILDPPVEVMPDSQSLYEYYLKVFSRAGAPPGFTPYRAVASNCGVWQVNGTVLRLTRAVWNSKYLLLEYSGRASQSLKLYTEAFSRTGDVAVQLSHGQVKSDQQFKVYIITRGGWSNGTIKRAAR